MGLPEFDLRTYEEIDEAKRLIKDPNSQLNREALGKIPTGKKPTIDGVESNSVRTSKKIPTKVLNNIGTRDSLLENISINNSEDQVENENIIPAGLEEDVQILEISVDGAHTFGTPEVLVAQLEEKLNK